MNNTSTKWFLAVGFALTASVLLITVNAEAEDAKPSLAISCFAGPTIPTPRYWNFVGLSYVNVEPRASYGFGVEYGPLRFTSGSRLLLSTEVVHSTRETGEYEIHSWYGGTASMSVNTTAAMVHAALLGESRMCPFIQLGLGAARVDFAELYSSDNLRDVKIDYWSLAYGLGAGIRYRATPRFAISLFCDSVCVPGERVESTGGGRKTGVLKEHWAVWAGLRLSVRL